MELHGPSIAGKAYGEDADKNLIVTYESHAEAHRCVAEALEGANGIAILQGPAGSGKTTILDELVPRLERESPVAVFDGAKSFTQPHVGNILSEFGIEAAAEPDDRLLQELSAYLTQKAASGAAPVLVVDNAEKLESNAISLLNWLADLDVRGRWAMRFVLTGTEQLERLVAEYSMRHFKRRHPVVCNLKPLSKREAVIYLRTRFIAAGGKDADELLSLDFCDMLHDRSGGWPGRINKLALKELSRGDQSAGESSEPRIQVSLEGSTVAEYKLTKGSTIIGRDQSADIVIDDNYVSNRHAVLQLDEAGVDLIDLNSTNGTKVNSIETMHAVLQNNDIIAIGQYRLKVENLPAVSEEMSEKIRRADTLTFEDPEDIRRTRAKRIIQESNAETGRFDRSHQPSSYPTGVLLKSAN